MKLKNKALLTSALILALAFAGVNSVKASDDISSDTSLESTEGNNKQDNVKTKDPVYCWINLYVKNRRVKDWLKDGSYYRIEGQDAKQLLQYSDVEKIEIQDNLIPGKKQKIEILEGKDGKVYAEGEINVIKDAKYGHKMDVEITPKNPIKTRKMTLLFKDKKNESRSLPNGKNYIFLDGKLLGEYSGTTYSIEDFEYEVGKKFKIEFRRKDKANSELLASIEDEMPAEGKLVESKSKDVYLRFPTDPKEDKKDSEKGSETTGSSGEKEDKNTGETSDGSKVDKSQANSNSNQTSNENKDGKDKNKSNESTHSSNDSSNGKPKNGSNQGNSMTVTPIPGAKDDKDKISEKSYKTREEAIEAAKKEMQTNTKWKSYYVIDQKDGTFKYGLSEKENNGQKGSTSTTTPNKLTTTNTQTQKPKSPLNVKTGVAGVGAVVGVLALSVIGYFVTKKKK